MSWTSVFLLVWMTYLFQVFLYLYLLFLHSLLLQSRQFLNHKGHGTCLRRHPRKDQFSGLLMLVAAFHYCDKTIWQKQLKGESIYSSLQFRGFAHHSVDLSSVQRELKAAHLLSSTVRNQKEEWTLLLSSLSPLTAQDPRQWMTTVIVGESSHLNTVMVNSHRHVQRPLPRWV